jgi:dihydrofolate reductase
LGWENSTLLEGDAVDAVTKVKQEAEHLTVIGSGELVRQLMRHGLIDEYLLLIHPLVLGSGQRLFSDGAFVRLRLADSVTTATGVVIGTHRSEEAG